LKKLTSLLFLVIISFNLSAHDLVIAKLHFHYAEIIIAFIFVLAIKISMSYFKSQPLTIEEK